MEYDEQRGRVITQTQQKTNTHTGNWGIWNIPSDTDGPKHLISAQILDLFLAVVFAFWLRLEWTPSLTTEPTQDQSWASAPNWGIGT